IEGREFALPAFSNVVDELLVAMAHEILERGGLAVFLAHQQERRQCRQKSNACRQLQCFEVDECREAFAEGAVADLIMILGTDDEAGALDPSGRIPLATTAEDGVFAAVTPTLLQRLRETAQFAKVGIVAVVL